MTGNGTQKPRLAGNGCFPRFVRGKQQPGFHLGPPPARWREGPERPPSPLGSILLFPGWEEELTAAAAAAGGSSTSPARELRDLDKGEATSRDREAQAEFLVFSMSAAMYFTHKGIYFPAVGYDVEKLSIVENEFQLLDDDVLNVTYPKSGTNWMQEILGLIRHNGDPSWVRSLPVWERSPWIEYVKGVKAALAYPPPRLMASHLPFQLFPKSFLQSKAKVIYTVRNPKDVLVSYYHYSKFCKILKEPASFQECLEEFLSGNVMYGSWFDHVKSWLEVKGRPNVFFNSYEEMQQDPRGSVEKICRFLGKELNSQQIDSVVENASFHKMKDNTKSNFTTSTDDIFDHEKGKLLRKGISGDWKNHLTVAQSERFDRVYREKMRGVDVTFPWD